MISSAKKNVQLFVESCIYYGLKYIVVSPGSRNAPLIIAFNQHPEIECIVVPDERSAAFFAMGMAQQTKDLVAVLCTSGSAPINYYPAITEAYYQRIPLIIITADRPQIWINQGDGQTIMQDNLFKNHINYNVNFDDVSESDDYHWYMKRELAEAFSNANVCSRGPIHLNFGFSEPLYQVENIEREKIERISLEIPKSNLTQEQISFLKKSWIKYPKKMILCGQIAPNSYLNQELSSLSKDSSLIVLCENTSNLTDNQFIHCIDRTLNSIKEDEIEDFAPDLLIYIGGAIVSKKIKAFLRKTKIKETWKVGLDFPFMDTFQSLTRSFLIEEFTFFRTLNNEKPSSYDNETIYSNYGKIWKQKDYLIQDKQKDYFLSKHNFSDISVFNLILDFIPDVSNLHLANSSVVRYSLLFDPVKSIKYWCNRGTSGIDGSTSTAAGSAYISKNLWNTLVTGDMSFFYDSNALWNHNLLPNFRIILINNGGGSIFKIIPGPNSTKELDEFFVYNNDFSAKSICEAFRISYLKAENAIEIENQMQEFYTYEENSRPKLLEIFTNNCHNEGILNEFFEEIKI
jgi:2-succinyl-5-enolpyruvyl-6-hydroxy-3-cyclohexene-1-carboxylate synthase